MHIIVLTLSFIIMIESIAIRNLLHLYRKKSIKAELLTQIIEEIKIIEKNHNNSVSSRHENGSKWE